MFYLHEEDSVAPDAEHAPIREGYFFYRDGKYLPTRVFSINTQGVGEPIVGASNVEAAVLLAENMVSSIVGTAPYSVLFKEV